MSSASCPLDRDVQNKLATVGADLEADIRAWIEGLVGEKFPDKSFGKSLKNGVILCNMINKIKPGICPKPQKSAAPFVQMENIGNYLAAVRKLGIQTENLFMTVDLYEEKNIGQVIRNLDTLHRLVGESKGSPVASAPAPASSLSPSATAATTAPRSASFSYPSTSSSSASSAPPRQRAGSKVPVGLREKEEEKSNTPLCPLDKDVQDKLSTVGSALEDDLRQWIENLTGEKFADQNFGKSLKNGILLCQLANKIRPGIVPKIQKSPAPFVQMENINAYLNAARQLGVDTENLFMTVDLFELKNIGQVIRNLDTLRRITGK